MNYIDIHTHTFYQDTETTLVLNVFPEEQEKWSLPCLFSVGLHPWHVDEKTWKELLEKVKTATGNKHVVAIGEAGLDKAVQSPYFLQQQAFEAQLEFAEHAKKPLIIHCVRSYSELLSYRKKSDLSIPWIFHWFNADEYIARELIRKNCYLSFGHMLFRESSKAYGVFQQIPVDHVFFETDDTGYSIKEIYQKAALIRHMEPDELKLRIRNNFEHCFTKYK